jgi:hypothetical protein
MIWNIFKCNVLCITGGIQRFLWRRSHVGKHGNRKGINYLARVIVIEISITQQQIVIFLNVIKAVSPKDQTVWKPWKTLNLGSIILMKNNKMHKWYIFSQYINHYTNKCTTSFYYILYYIVCILFIYYIRTSCAFVGVINILWKNARTNTYQDHILSVCSTYMFRSLWSSSGCAVTEYNNSTIYISLNYFIL